MVLVEICGCMSVSSPVLGLVLRHVPTRMGVYFCFVIVLVGPGTVLSLGYDTLLLCFV